MLRASTALRGNTVIARYPRIFNKMREGQLCVDPEHCVLENEQFILGNEGNYNHDTRD